MNPARPFLVVVDGPMGVGKTTVVKKLCELLSLNVRVKALLELEEDADFKEKPMVPSIEEYYREPKKHALAFQSEMLSRRFEQLDLALQRRDDEKELEELADQMDGAATEVYERMGPIFICDRHPLSCNAFAWCQYKAGHLSLAEYLQLYNKAKQQTFERHAWPALVFILNAKTSILLGRIQQRGRPGEELISKNYLKSLTSAFGDMYRDMKTNMSVQVHEIQVGVMSTPAEIAQEIAKRVIDSLRECLPAVARGEQLKVTRMRVDASIPIRATCRAIGLDLASPFDVSIPAGERTLIMTGLKISLPRGCYGRIAARSGLSWRFGINILGGVIDPDYTGEIKVVLVNHGREAFEVKKGDRIAQLIVERAAMVSIMEVVASDHESTCRGTGGFGSTN